MKVARSGYYRFRDKKGGPAKGNGDMRLLIEVKALHKESDKSYGSRRISEALKVMTWVATKRVP